MVRSEGSMIKVFAHNLNSHGDTIHPVCRYALETLIYFMPDQFQESSLRDSDMVLTNAPACPPYSFDVRTAEQIESFKKPVFILSDADGYMPDCEGDSPDKIHNFQNFVRYYEWIKGYFYREFWEGYERPDLKFPLITFELVGYLWSKHPKDRANWGVGINREMFLGRKWDVTMAQSLGTKSRQEMFKALDGFPNCNKRDLVKAGKFPGELWMNELLTTKLAISLEGAGIKCMSDCEIPHCAILVLHGLPMRYTYSWIDGVNCIRLPYWSEGGEGSFIKPEGRGMIDAERSVFRLREALKNPDTLWNIFQACQENARNYELGNYWKNYVGANIVRLL